MIIILLLLNCRNIFLLFLDFSLYFWKLSRKHWESNIWLPKVNLLSRWKSAMVIVWHKLNHFQTLFSNFLLLIVLGKFFFNEFPLLHKKIEKLFAFLLHFFLIIVYKNRLHYKLIKPIEVFRTTSIHSFTLFSFFIWMQNCFIFTFLIWCW